MTSNSQSDSNRPQGDGLPRLPKPDEDVSLEATSDSARPTKQDGQELQDTATCTFQSKANRPGSPLPAQSDVGEPVLADEDSDRHSPDAATPSFDACRFVESLGRFSEVQAVGQGTSGTVLRATDNVLGRPVAIKVLRAETAAASNACFQTEARRLARLDHPGICRVYDFGTHDGRPYLVTEWLAGKSLAQIPKPCDWPAACGLIADVADAMAYAHQREVVHRDLKPANVMVDARDRIRVIDFGLALDDHEESRPRLGYCGSPAYMAPEQVGGRVDLMDGRVDVWAMGVMLYEMLTGKRPFRGANSSDVLTKIRDKPAAPPRTFQPEIPAALEQIILACLEKQPTDRIATASDLSQRLRDLWHHHQEDSETVPASSTVGDSGNIHPSLRPGSRRRILLFAAMIICGGSLAAFYKLGNGVNTAENPAQPQQDSGAGLAEAAPVMAARNYLRVNGRRPTTDQRWSIDALQPNSPSIESGDRVSLSIRLEQPLHLYLVWFGTDTGTTYLYPGPLGDNTQIGNPAVDQPVDTLDLPIGTITPTPSTETVLLVATQTPFDGPAAFATLIASLPRPDLSRVVAPGGFRGIHFDAQQWPQIDAESPKLREALAETIRYLQRELGDDAIVQAVSFASAAP